MEPAKKLNEKFTYSDYLTWNDNERWELINGIAYNMSPAPKTSHQYISINLSVIIGYFLKNKKCCIFAAPFDVRLTGKNVRNDSINTVVQPDLSIICDKGKLDEAGCCGAPDFIIEILSLSTSKKDVGIKKDLYENNGVKEYWIVEPWTETVRVYLLKNHKYEKAVLYEGMVEIPVQTLPNLKVLLKDIFKKD